MPPMTVDRESYSWNRSLLHPCRPDFNSYRKTGLADAAHSQVLVFGKGPRYAYLGLNNFPFFLKHLPRGAHVSPIILSLD